MTTIICVHGSGPKPDDASYRSLWHAALRRGIERESAETLAHFDACEFEFVYFADLTRKLIGEEANEALTDRQQALDALCSLSKSKQFRRSAYEALPGKSPVREFAADIAAPILRATGFDRTVKGKLVPELGAYWRNDEGVADALRSRIENALGRASERGGRCILISHGFGNVPTWDALWAMSRQSPQAGANVDLWLSLGSPLADDTVRASLAGSDRASSERYPTNIARWHNLAAEDDFFCHDETMANDFAEMQRTQPDLVIEDFRIYNLAVRSELSAPHHSSGYLVHPRCARSLIAALSGNAP